MRQSAASALKKISLAVAALLAACLLAACLLAACDANIITAGDGYLPLSAPFTADYNFTIENMRDGFVVYGDTMPEAAERDIVLEVWKAQGVGTMTFQLILRPGDGEDILLYDYVSMQSSYLQELTVSIPAGYAELILTGRCDLFEFHLDMTETP